jgi:ubiquinone biosynthesis accessory factor UbiK
MIDINLIDDIAQRLSEAVPTEMKHFAQELQQNFRSILQATFNAVDLVSREEFDAQKNVLQRTRERLEILEAQLQQLESDIAPKASNEKSSPSEEIKPN